MNNGVNREAALADRRVKAKLEKMPEDRVRNLWYDLGWEVIGAQFQGDGREADEYSAARDIVAEEYERRVGRHP